MVAVRQFTAFLLVGGIAALCNWSSRFAFSMFCNFSVAVVLAYCVGMLIAFVLMRLFVFKESSRRTRTQIPIFVAVNLLAVLQTLAVSLLLARWLLPSLGVAHNAEAIAHLVGVLVPAFTSYLGHKLFTFS
jgi:putative flippase GtrA